MDAQIHTPGRNGRAHFAGLDGLRGIAALTVVMYHTFLPLHLIVAAKGYLAVDFFFLLSGLVVANAYERRLLNGLTFLRFVGIRLARLYPLFLLGMTMGIVVSALKVLTVVHTTDVFAFASAAVRGLLMVPFAALPYSPSEFAFPFNGPAWSLFFEYLVNFSFAAIVCGRRLTGRSLAAIVAGSGLLLALVIWSHGSVDVGGKEASFGGGVVRTSFSFFTGVAISRLQLARGVRRISGGNIVATVTLAAVLLVPLTIDDRVFDLFAVFVVFPFVIVSSTGDEPVGFVRMIASFLGKLSYPLYVTHYPIMRVFQYLEESRHLAGFALYRMIGLELTTMIGFATLALYLYDAQIQAWIKRRKGVARPASHRLSPRVTDSVH